MRFLTRRLSLWNKKFPFLNALKNWIYPSSCLHCGYGNAQFNLCQDCFSLIETRLPIQKTCSIVALFENFGPIVTLVRHRCHEQLAGFFIIAMNQLNWQFPEGITSFDEES